MADDYDDGSLEIFVAVVSLILLVVVGGYLVYTGVIHDWITALSAIGILIVYVALSTFLAPYVIATGPTKGQSAYDASNYDRNRYNPNSRKGQIPPMGYIFGAIMPGYFIGKSVIWLFGLMLGGGDDPKSKKKK